MRTIKFRGKSIETSKWVYGYYVHEGMGRHLIIYYSKKCKRVFTIEVDPKTVNQYTGCNDKQGQEIYENDYLLDEFLSDITLKVYSKVIFSLGGYVTVVDNEYFELREENETSVVAGNVTDNPELEIEITK